MSRCRALSSKITGLHIDQSATATPSSPHHSVAPPISSTKQSRTTSDAPPRRLTSPLSPPEGSYSTLQPGHSATDPRSAQARRPPASRSSHGIETTLGPPPALSTQRSYAESPWQSHPPSDSRTTKSPSRLPRKANHSINSITDQSYVLTNEHSSFLSRPARVQTRPSTSDGVMTAGGAQSYGRFGNDEEGDSTLRLIDQGRHTKMQPKNVDQKSSQPAHEDLFLDLARDDSVVDEPVRRSERRRSRVGISSSMQTWVSRPSSSDRPNTSGGAFGEYGSPHGQKRSNGSSFDSPFHHLTERNRAYAASAHPLDQQNQIRNKRASFGLSGRGTSIEERSLDTSVPYRARRKSTREHPQDFNSWSIKQSESVYNFNGNDGPSPAQPLPPQRQDLARGMSHAEDTESTVSTTAPSTVWDELDDLKSRLRKLELTGILPKSSDAAMSTALVDRPLTATTTVTTMSSSPKRQQMESISLEASTIKSLGNPDLHPLLHSALAKAKPSVKDNLYQALEATAGDALSLAALVGSGGSQGDSPNPASIVGSTNTIDRQLRRKADSMCRGLTELCIALAEDAPENEGSRRRSRDTISAEVAPPTSKLLRGSSETPEGRASSRVMSRLEARRVSLLGSSPSSVRRVSSQEATTPTQTVTPVPSRSDRNLSVLRQNRTNGEEIGIQSNSRPRSRATTEIAQIRPSPQTRVSREYTSQHPMPSNLNHSPSLQSSLPRRKSYFSSTSSSPLTPSLQAGNKKYPDRSTPPSSADSARIAQARQRRMASLSQGQSRIGLSSGGLRQPESEQQH